MPAPSASWPLPVLSVLSLLVLFGSAAWAQTTDAQPHASAAEAGSAEPTFTVCAGGDYPTYVLLTESKTKTATAQPGACVTQKVADAEATYAIQVYGLEGAKPFLIGDDEVAADSEVKTTGTIESPDWTTE